MKRWHKNRWRRRAPIRIPKRPELAAPPGTVPSPSEGPREARVDALRFGPESFEEETLQNLEKVSDIRSGARVCWVNVDSVEDPSKLKKLAEIFGWHSLVLEDVVSLHQRPKAEDYDDYVYVVLLMPSGLDGLPLEQLSLLFGKGYVVTVQAGIPGDTLEAVRERIRKGRGRIRGAEADYLAYAIIDAVVDHYFPVVENLNARLERIEANLGAVQDDAAFEDVHSIRNDLHTARRAVSATGEAVGRLVRGEAGIVSESTRIYLRDCQDHCPAPRRCRGLSRAQLEPHGAARSSGEQSGGRRHAYLDDDRDNLHADELHRGRLRDEL